VKIADGKVWSNFATLIIPYCLYHLLLVLREYHLLWITHKHLGTPINLARFMHRTFSAQGQMFTYLDNVDEAWYLMALFMWRLSVPYVRLLKHPVLVAYLSYVVTYCCHVCDSVAFVRTFQYYPFFVAGLLMNDQHIEIMRNRWVQFVSLFFFRYLWQLCRADSEGLTTDVLTPELGVFPSQQPWIAVLAYYHPLGLVCCAAACSLSLGVLDFRNVITEPYSLMTLFNYLLHYHPAMVLIEHFGCLNMADNRVDPSKPNLVGPAIGWSGSKVRHFFFFDCVLLFVGPIS
jgi:fucose 4-O-acetylase-like acetyltransferase